MKPQKSHKHELKSEIFCPECEARLNSDLVDVLLKGHTVYCEMCGFPFIGIINGDVKPLNKIPEQRFDTPILSKKERQWIKWKKTWNKIKPKTDITTYPSHDTSLNKINGKNQPSNRYIKKKNSEPLKTSSKIGFSKNEPSIFKPYSPFMQFDFLKSAKILTIISPIYYILITIITLVVFISNGMNIVNFISLLLFEGFIIYEDFKYYNQQVRNQNIRHAGIPMILMGLLSMHAFGIGLFLLLKGLLCLFNFIQMTKKNCKFHPVVHRHESTKVLWIQEIIRSFGEILAKMIYILIISAILNSFDQVLYFNGSLGFLIWSIIACIITIIVFHKYLHASLEIKDIKKISSEIAAIGLIMGFFSLQIGYGILLLIWGILILYFNEINGKMEKTIPYHDDIKDYKYRLVLNESIANVDEKARNFNKGHPNKNNVDNILSIEEKKRENQIYHQNMNTNITQNTLVSHNPLDNHDLSINSDSDQNQVYILLKPDQRNRLLKLNIDEDEKDIIARTFIYMSESQQNSYLEELEQVNSDSLISQDILNRLETLPISIIQQEKLKKQLQYIPLDEQIDFISFIEDTISHSTKIH